MTRAHVDHPTEILARTMRAHASPEMQRTLLPALLRGELGPGCLLYSEPGAGSDLASLQTRADRDGERYVVNGQKVWSSMAVTASWGILVARTDWNVPKHRGLTVLVLPMKEEGGERRRGIEVRPIRQITGEAHFNEVFLTDVTVPVANQVGNENEGWQVLQTALTHERAVMGSLHSAPSSSMSVDLVDAARRAGRAGDAVVRQRVAQLYSWRRVQEWNRHRLADPASLGKLANSRILHAAGALLQELDGARSLLYDYAGIDPATPNFRAMKAFVNSIGGGSDEIQRNIIGERLLGLPREPEPDRDRPFRDVPKGVAVRRFS
jgi:alkylation response protein AidB-like acyl-CoA dehydrogenase